MITGKLVDLAHCADLNEELRKKLAILKEIDFSQYPAGRHEINDELFFFLNEYETKEAEECFWEAHQKYLDVHYILEGKEKIAFDHIDRQMIKEDYNAEKDATFFEGVVDSVISMNPGEAMICYPEDSHMTGIVAGEKQKVRKVVLKVECKEILRG